VNAILPIIWKWINVMDHKIRKWLTCWTNCCGVKTVLNMIISWNRFREEILLEDITVRNVKVNKQVLGRVFQVCFCPVFQKGNPNIIGMIIYIWRCAWSRIESWDLDNRNVCIWTHIIINNRSWKIFLPISRQWWCSFNFV
jgi:hypothetical protein